MMGVLRMHELSFPLADINAYIADQEEENKA